MKTSSTHTRINAIGTSGKSTSENLPDSLKEALGVLSQKIDQENKDEINAEILKIMRDIELNEDMLKMIILLKERDMSDVLQLLFDSNSRLVNSKLVFKLLEEVNPEHQAMIESLVSEIIKSETGVFPNYRDTDSSGNRVALIHSVVKQGMVGALGLLLDNKKNLFEKYIKLLNDSAELLKKGAALVNQSVELLGGARDVRGLLDEVIWSLEKGAQLVKSSVDLLNPHHNVPQLLAETGALLEKYIDQFSHGAEKGAELLAEDRGDLKQGISHNPFKKFSNLFKRKHREGRLLGEARKNNYYTFFTNNTEDLKVSLSEGAHLICKGCNLLEDTFESMPGGEELLKVAADLEATTNPTKCNVLHVAVFSGKIEIVDLLFKHFPKESLANVNMNRDNILHIAAANGDKRMFDFLCEKLESLMTEKDFYSMILCKNLLGKTPANASIAKSDSIQTSSPHPEVSSISMSCKHFPRELEKESAL